jgi:hypothetical protein
MEQRDFDELIAYARQAGQLLKTVFKDLADEELDLESAVRSYPILALTLAAGAGAAAGWWAAHRRRAVLPPPPPESGSDQTTQTTKTASYLEQRFPNVERLRKAIPDSMKDDAATMARNWMDSLLEPKIRQGVDNLSANVAESKWATLIKQAVQKMDSGEDIQLEDPEENQT